jgi:hypothetical protein
MAKDQFSFDIVSEVDLQEVLNAVQQAGKEIATMKPSAMQHQTRQSLRDRLLGLLFQSFGSVIWPRKLQAVFWALTNIHGHRGQNKSGRTIVLA